MGRYFTETPEITPGLAVGAPVFHRGGAPVADVDAAHAIRAAVEPAPATHRNTVQLKAGEKCVTHNL